MALLLDTFEKRFFDLHRRSCYLVEKTPRVNLFWHPADLASQTSMYSCGEFTLRSAAMVERAFGGITTRLWDDPFEWTLPEELGSKEKILEYLEEVESTRVEGFRFVGDDSVLTREIPAPRKLRSLFEIILESLVQAEHFHGRAVAVFQLFSKEKLPAF